MELGKLGPIRGHATVVKCRPFLGRGVTILLVLERQFLIKFYVVLNPADIGIYNLIKNCHLNSTCGH